MKAFVKMCLSQLGQLAACLAVTLAPFFLLFHPEFHYSHESHASLPAWFRSLDKVPHA